MADKGHLKTRKDYSSEVLEQDVNYYTIHTRKQNTHQATGGRKYVK